MLKTKCTVVPHISSVVKMYIKQPTVRDMSVFTVTGDD